MEGMAKCQGTGMRAHPGSVKSMSPSSWRGLPFAHVCAKAPRLWAQGHLCVYQAMYCFVLASYSSWVAARKPVRAPLSSRTA